MILIILIRVLDINEIVNDDEEDDDDEDGDTSL